jgi:hypothetical protein
MRRRAARAPIVVGLPAFLLGANAAAAKPGMPEPILTETVTDIDGREAGELEISANAFGLALGHGARAGEATVEAEWRVTDRLGLRLEPAYAYERSARGAGIHAFEIQAGAAWGLLHDWRRDFHLQIELTGHGGNEPAGDQARRVHPGDPALPLALDLRAGIRRGLFTVRTGFGVEALGPAGDRVGLRAGAALLTSFGAGERFGYTGVELEADSARRRPFVVAPNVVADAAPLGLPFRLGVALPWIVGAGPCEPRLGVYLRLIFETELGEHEGPVRPRSEDMQ